MAKITKLFPTSVDECLKNAKDMDFTEVMVVGVKNSEIFFGYTDIDLDKTIGRLELLKLHVVGSQDEE